ncbi:hypothetical protein ACHAW5_000775 [Stephanodiscus triporus]|uniref:Uncharacterized protein n=1 Tax=Stephanodiscus triporus TaxID=2934178 RepID=A0ABD3QSK5_9STRA
MVIDIPDDDSEASLMVLMRYIGCSPDVYGGGPRGRGRRQIGPMSNKYGREYTFDDDYGEADSLLSDETWGSTVCEEDIEPSWTIENNEVGVEYSVQDVILASHGSLSLSPDGSLVRNKTTNAKGKPNLTVETKKKKKKMNTAASVATTTSPGSASPVSAVASPTAAKLAAHKDVLMKFAEEMKSPKVNKPSLSVDTTEETKKMSKEKGTVVGSTGLVINRSDAKVKKPCLTVDTTRETKKTSKKKGTVVGSSGLVISPTVGCPPDEDEVKTPTVCMTSTPKSPEPKSSTLVSWAPTMSLQMSSPEVSSPKSSTTKLSKPKSSAFIPNVQSTSASKLNSQSQNHVVIEESSSIQSDKEDSFSTRSDKENGTMHEEENSPLNDNPTTAVEPINLALLSTGDKKDVCEEDYFLSMTRELLSSTRNNEVDSHFFASDPLERKIMGSISSNSLLHSPTAKVSSPLAFATNITSKEKEGTSSTLTLSPLSNAAISSPTKSILEQLAEVRAKQRVLEERYTAKREMRH